MSDNMKPARTWTKTDHEGNIIEQKELDVTWEEVRKYRNRLLADSDWRAVKDRVFPNEWKEYRQALRDITNHRDANTAVDNWPVMPSD